MKITNISVRYFLYALILHLALLSLGTFFVGHDFKYILNFELAFFGFALVAILSFLQARKMILQRVENLECEGALNSKKQDKSIFLGFKAAFSLVRIGAYVLFFALLFALLHFGFFNLIGFVVGVFCALACILVVLKGRL